MTFLNASLLVGLFAAAIPIAVHLISRRQPRRVVFPATRFLQHRIESSRSRLKVRRWWLLALRILAVAAFAFALARPEIETSMAPRWFAVALLGFLAAALMAMAGVAMVKGKSAGLRYGLTGAAAISLIAALITAGASAARGPELAMTDDSPVALAIVMDNSVRSARRLPSASAESNPGDRVIDQMRDHAQWMLSRYASSSRIAVIDRSLRPAAFAVDNGSAKRQIERTEPLALTRPLTERIDAAIRLVRSSDLPRRMVLVITDLTQHSFQDSEWAESALPALLAQEPPLRLQILDVGLPPAGNRKLGPLVISDMTPPQMTTTAVSSLITVDGHSQTGTPSPDSRSVTVELQLFDSSGDQSESLPMIRDSTTVLPPLRSVDRTTVDLSSAASRVLLSVPPLDVGIHHGVVRILGDDELAIDDRRFFTLQVRPAAALLLVASDSASAGVIGGALTAPLAIDDPAAEYRIEISEWLPSQREAYANYAAIILIDPAPPSPATAADLKAYLASGGKLISLLGPALGSAGLASSPGATPTADAATTFWPGISRRWRVPAPGTFLEIVRPSHGSVAALADIAGGVPWNAFAIDQYWQLEPQVGDSVVIRYAGTDHPALIDRRSDTNGGHNGSSGAHLILTTPLPALAGPARLWNDLFSGTDAWPAFLLVREMVQSLIDAEKGTHNVFIGDLPTIPLLDLTVAGDVPMQMFPPVGPAVPLRTSGSVATVGNVEHPGTYWLRAAGQTTGFSVNLPDGITSLQRIDPALLETWLGTEQYDLAHNRDELRQAQGRGEPTRPLYGWILLLMASAFVLEQILSNRFYRSARVARAASLNVSLPRFPPSPTPSPSSQPTTTTARSPQGTASP